MRLGASDLADAMLRHSWQHHMGGHRCCAPFPLRNPQRYAPSNRGSDTHSTSSISVPVGPLDPGDGGRPSAPELRSGPCWPHDVSRICSMSAASSK